MVVPVLLSGVLTAAVAAGPVVEQQHLSLHLSPEAHKASVTSRLRLRGAGDLDLRLTDKANVTGLLVNGDEAEVVRAEAADEPGDIQGVTILTVHSPLSLGEVVIEYDATLVEDVEAGERPGEIHNKAVHAHVAPEGVFLSDGAAWHPQPIGEDGHPALHPISIDIEPMDGWVLVASGDPAIRPADLADPVWRWTTPRPVDGMAVAGGHHDLHGRRHQTVHGAVDVVVHVPPEHARYAPMFLDAACDYLDLYVPRLGTFPYARFSIVENFFSSGFAYPGFTLLGPRVVAMAPRSLAPGYLDHELLHNWWGNGVYVDPDDGNWCEGLTSYCANYMRRVLEDGPEAGRDYRRDVLMRLSGDPAGLDDGPLGEFGRHGGAGGDGGPGRFVGYDKATFVFAMLARLIADDPDANGDDAVWPVLRAFADVNMGRRAGWPQLQAAFETTHATRSPGWLDGFFDMWVREHTVPRTIPGDPRDARREFAEQYQRAGSPVDVLIRDGGIEIDPDFTLYRVLPPQQIIPTIAGTTGAGGLAVAADASRPEVAELLAQLDADDHGENLMIVGAAAAEPYAALLRRSSDPIELGDGQFTVGGITYDDPAVAVLHTMQHPDRPGRFITVFHSNGDAGWSRLRLVRFYTRDTTIIWAGDRVIERRTYEPDRVIRPDG